MPPGIRLEILVDDKGSPVVKQFNETVDKTPASVDRTGSSFASTAASAVKFAAGLTGLYVGLQTLASGIQGAASSAIAFEAALANVNTLGIRSTDTQQKLRSELLQLPPILGSSTELATGLYEVLSSGIAPTKAVQFLADAANLAQAGLAQLDTSTIALTKTMAAYNLPAEDAGRVSDILFKTVEIGQGSLQQFAGALPQVTQLAASMGVSLEDTANAMATLSQTFRNADTAATGFRSLLQQLIQNSDKFLALGINIRQVISEQGLLGAVKVLQQVSQGSSERLRGFVNDVEGFNAALALTGPQFSTLVANQEKFKNASGSVAEAVRIQTQTTSAAWKELTNTVDRSVQALGPAVTGTLTTILNAGTALLSDINTQVLGIPKAFGKAKQDLDKIAPEFAATVRMLLSAPVSDRPAELSAQQLHERLLQLPTSAQGAAKALGLYADQNSRATALLNEGLLALQGVTNEQLRATAAQEASNKKLAETNLQLTSFGAALKEVKST